MCVYAFRSPVDLCCFLRQGILTLLHCHIIQDVKADNPHYLEFLKSEFSDENIEFWLACEDYKKTQADNLHSKAEKIYKEFVQSNVNIDFHTRKDIAKEAQDPTPSSFNEAQRLVFVLMERDSYPRFLKSRFYRNLLSKVECNSLK
uniref:Regulator of G-protein signaling 1 n=1 Tax=Anolis carolinensis TaxID=28377 RepID=A0A803TGU0_ANOCA